MSSFLKDKSSYIELLKTISAFSNSSGVKINEEKTKIMAIGPTLLSEGDFIHEIKNEIKILGIFFAKDLKEKRRLNFDLVLKSIKQSLNSWKWRGLSLIGRIQIVKTFAIPKFMYRASLICVSKEILKKVNEIIFSFIWNGKDKIKRSALICDYDEGGLRMLDIESMINTKKIMCLKKYLEPYPSPWKNVVDFYFKKLGGRFLLKCNFDIKKLAIDVPKFYIQGMPKCVEPSK